MNSNLDNIEIDGYEDALNQNVDVEELETATPFLTVLVIDASGSMCDYSDSYSGIMGDCLRNCKNAIVNSKQADEMLLAKITFDEDVNMGGFVKPEDLDCTYSTGGRTALYDAVIAARKLILDYMDQILNTGGTPRGCVVVLSDGWDNESSATDADTRKAVADMQKHEITVAFITFGSGASGIAQSLGVDSKNILDCQNDEHSLRMALNMVSKSAISASKRASAGLGTGNTGFFDV